MREEGTQSQRVGQSKSCVGLERTWDDEDEDGGVVGCAEAVMEDHWQGLVERSKSPTSWVRHHFHDLDGEASKHGSEWVRTWNKNDALVEGCGSWGLEPDPRPVGQSKAPPAPPRPYPLRPLPRPSPIPGLAEASSAREARKLSGRWGFWLGC